MNEPTFTPKHNPQTGITSYTINPPSYFHNTQGQKREMTLNGYQEVVAEPEPVAEKPKRKRVKKDPAIEKALAKDLNNRALPKTKNDYDEQTED